MSDETNATQNAPTPAESTGQQSEKKFSDEDLRTDKIRSLFDEMRPGYRLVISRLSPAWCYGWLETLEIMPDSEIIDLDYISNLWGGNKLRLQLQGENRKFIRTADVWIAHPPRYQGSAITPESWASRHNQGVDFKQQQQPSRETGINPVDLLKTMSQLRAEDLDLLRKMTTNSQKQTIIEQPKNQMQDIISMARTWKQLQGLFGVVEAQPAVVIPQAVDDTGNLIAQITGLISAFKGQGQQPQQSRPQRITPPQQAPRPQPQPKQKPKQQISSVLADMETDKLNEILLTAFSSMSQNKREIVIENFLRSSGLMSAEDGDDGDDEPDDHEDPNGQSVGDDEDNDQTDRPGY